MLNIPHLVCNHVKKYGQESKNNKRNIEIR